MKISHIDYPIWEKFYLKKGRRIEFKIEYEWIFLKFVFSIIDEGEVKEPAIWFFLKRSEPLRGVDFEEMLITEYWKRRWSIFLPEFRKFLEDLRAKRKNEKI
jgi:hypothetical protein